MQSDFCSMVATHGLQLHFTTAQPANDLFPITPPTWTAIPASHRVLLSLSMLPCQSLPAAPASPGDETSPSSHSALLENPRHCWAKTRRFLCHHRVGHNPEIPPPVCSCVLHFSPSTHQAGLETWTWLELPAGEHRTIFIKLPTDLIFFIYLKSFQHYFFFFNYNFF